jgi:hypothetical protein
MKQTVARLLSKPARLVRKPVVIAPLVLAALVVGAMWWRASWIVTQLLGSWATATVTEKSGDVYRLEVGHVRFNFVLRRVMVDSIHVTTNRAVNTLRSRPLAAMRLAFHQCKISGVHIITLVRSGGLVAGSFGCRAVSVSVAVPRGMPESTVSSEPRAARRAFLVLQQGLRLPSFAPRVRIARIDLAHVVLDFRLQRGGGLGDSRLELEHLQWRMTDLAIDPADTTAATHPLFSRTVELAATNFVAHPDSGTAVRVGALLASLTDSTLEVQGVAVKPTLSDGAFARSQRYRRGLMKTSIGRVAVQGLDVGAFALGQGLRARRIQLDSLRLEITSDRRRPANPTQQRYRTPQGWMADFDRTISVDSVLFRDGEIVYRERRGDHAQAGVITFARLDAVAANVRHYVGRRNSGDPMTLRATAHLQNVGRLDVQFVVPLDAPRFNMTFRGTLGAMPAASLNVFVRETFPLRISKGQIVGMSFRATVVNGVAVGTITPRYNDLRVAVTRRGSGGILGSGGLLGGAARGIASLVGNWTQLRSNNPDDAEAVPRSGTIHHTLAPDETLPAFLWASIRDGLMAVVRK